MTPARPPQPRPHVRPAEGEVNEILGYGRVLWFMRVTGFLIVAVQAPLYQLVSPVLVVLGLAILGTTIALQPWLMRDDLGITTIRRQALGGLVADILAVFIVSTAFTADPAWLGFYFYPLVALEATLVAGAWAGVAVTLVSIVVYLLQLMLFRGYGYPIDAREVAAAVAFLGLTGSVLSAFGGIAERGRRDLRMLLDLTSALANQQAEVETIELLDRRLAGAVGGRVRSVALRRPDGGFDILRWHSDERRILTRDALERAMGDVDVLEDQFASGTSLTYAVEAGSGLTEGLGLPGWARSVTLVPISVEGGWVGILPILWPAATLPDRHQLRLLYGLSNQVGLALAQGQLQRVREEAATDALTGLPNRRTILGDLASFVARAERSGGMLAVLFCDLDGFKSVNDRHGHERGDEVLHEIAGAVRDAMRQGDVIGRYGGDELLVVAADADAEAADQLAHRIGEAVRAAGGSEGLDVTIGIAIQPQDGQTATELVSVADQAMYRGKLRGPGSIVIGRPGTGDLTASA